jgi:hypothetical protein
VPARRRRPSDRARETLEADLAALEEHRYRELRQRFEALYGTACRAKLSRRILRHVVAYRMQEQVLGGLGRATRRCLDLDKAVGNLAAGRPIAPSSERLPACSLRPGTGNLALRTGISAPGNGGPRKPGPGLQAADFRFSRMILG